MTTKQIIEKMEKEFFTKIAQDYGDWWIDENSPGDYYLDDGSARDFLRSSIRTLLESFGEEIINRLEEDVKVVIESEVVKEGNVINECISGVFGNERLKVKEILQNIT